MLGGRIKKVATINKQNQVIIRNMAKIDISRYIATIPPRFYLSQYVFKKTAPLGSYCENCGVMFVSEKAEIYLTYHVCSDCKKSLEKEKKTMIQQSAPNLNDYHYGINYSKQVKYS